LTPNNWWPSYLAPDGPGHFLGQESADDHIRLDSFDSPEHQLLVQGVFNRIGQVRDIVGEGAVIAGSFGLVRRELVEEGCQALREGVV
jgi:hypothetical protein